MNPYFPQVTLRANPTKLKSPSGAALMQLSFRWSRAVSECGGCRNARVEASMGQSDNDRNYPPGYGEFGLNTLLGDVLNAIPGRAAAIYTPNLPHGATEAIWLCVGVAPEFLREYVDRYRCMDVWAEAASRPSPPPTGSVIDTDRLVDREILRRSEFHNEFLAQYEIGRCLMAIVDDGRSGQLPHIRLDVMRSEAEPGFSGREMATLRMIARIARSVVQLMIAHEAADRRALLRQSALDLVRTPVLLVDHDRNLLTANRAADEFLAECGPLEIRGGRLRLRDRAADRSLGAALQRVVSTRVETQFVRLGPGRPLLPAPALMISAMSDAPDSERSGALVVRVLRPDSPPEGSGLVLRDLLGLTPAESAVALGIAEGLSQDQIAQRRGVTVSTVRSLQRRLQEKLGFSRSGPMARFVLGTVAAGGLRY